MALRITAVVLALAAPAFARATPPEACTILTLEEVNAIAGGVVEKIQPRKSGNPSECGYLDGRRAAVLVVSIREVQYAAENELQYERENLEKIYRAKVKWVPTVGESAFWLGANKQLGFARARRSSPSPSRGRRTRTRSTRRRSPASSSRGSSKKSRLRPA